MQRWTKKKTIISGVVALLISAVLGAGAYATHQWIQETAMRDIPVPTKKVTYEPYTPPPDITAEELMIGVNIERVKAGLGSLAVNAALNQSACMKADDLISKNYWGHDSPEGLTPGYWMKQAGYFYTRGGENLAYGYLMPDSVIKGWMNSPGHKRNILDPTFTEMGMCVKYGKYQEKIRTGVIVNHFGSL